MQQKVLFVLFSYTKYTMPFFTRYFTVNVIPEFSYHLCYSYGPMTTFCLSVRLMSQYISLKTSKTFEELISNSHFYAGRPLMKLQDNLISRAFIKLTQDQDSSA